MTRYDYKTRAPRGYMGDPRRGAALGRRALIPEDTTQPIMLHLQRVPLDRGGYDRCGTYWGLGDPIYVAGDAEGTAEITLRAPTRELAKECVRDTFPNARFFK